MNLSIIGVQFVSGIAVVTVGVVVVGVRVVHARLLRVITLAVATLFGVGTTAAAANAYYGYLPTVGALLGQRARDQASTERVWSLAMTSTIPSYGLVERVSIPAPVSHFDARPAQVYLPPAWFATPRPRLPVIELLHGTPGTPEDWTRAAQADVTADRWAVAHHGRAPIILLVDENGSFTADTECADGIAGRAETYLTVDVPAWAVTNLGAERVRSAWGIGGNSEGGYCALTLALRHRALYSLFMDFSGLDRPTRRGGVLRLFGDSRAARDAHTPRLLLLRRPRRAPRLDGWFEVGAADGGTTRSILAIAAKARAAGVRTHLVVVPRGHHTWRVWRRSFADAFPWAASRLGAT
jgi:S-formylglutathione hydrolase FrmB